MATEVEQAIVEMNQALEVIKPELEGFEDFERLNIEEVARPRVTEQRTFYRDRRTLLRAAITALQALNEHGHPDLPDAGINEASMATLLEQQASINAAIKKFKVLPTLVSIEHDFSEPEPKA